MKDDIIKETIAPCGLCCETCFAHVKGEIRKLSIQLKEKLGNFHINAKRFETITYLQALNLGLAVMDSTALTLCMDNNMPISVLNMWQPDSPKNTVMGSNPGTFVGN